VTSTSLPNGAREALLAAARAELVEHGRAAISLRAVARRAGVSHAAPKYHFRDRAGLLTAIATEGFQALTRALSQVSENDPQRQLAALGRAYVDFGLANPALFELMFAPDQLHSADSGLIRAQQDAIAALSAAASRLTPRDAAPSGFPTLALVSWAVVHGLVVLVRDGALQRAAGTDSGTDVAHILTDYFTDFVGKAFAADVARPRTRQR
jgi:AcrR family transcriptional regulator